MVLLLLAAPFSVEAEASDASPRSHSPALAVAAVDLPEWAQVAIIDALDQHASQNRFEEAESLLSLLQRAQADPATIAAARNTIARARRQWTQARQQSFGEALAEARFEQAEREIARLVALGLSPDRAAAMRNELEDARRHGGRAPGSDFQDLLVDGSAGPVMVVVPAGSFRMGSPANEPDRLPNEGPRHQVRFASGFALARTEVNVAQFRDFVEDTGHVTDAERRGHASIYLRSSGRIARRSEISWRDDFTGQPADESLPVIHVSWADANAYAEWLAVQTGQPYRLPSEAEFEYALRSGSNTRYWWGDDAPDQPTENVTGQYDRFLGDRRWRVAFAHYRDGFWGPGPVGQLAPNPFGLHDLGGNVMEWVADCWHDSYVRAPSDGSAWINRGCSRRVLRGGSWSSTPAMSRSAYRVSARFETTDPRAGFRVAREL